MPFHFESSFKCFHTSRIYIRYLIKQTSLLANPLLFTDVWFGYHFPLIYFYSRPFSGEDSKSRVFITISKSKMKNSTLTCNSCNWSGHWSPRLQGEGLTGRTGRLSTVLSWIISTIFTIVTATQASPAQGPAVICQKWFQKCLLCWQ